VAIADIAAGEDDVGDIAMAMGENPTGTDMRERAKRWLGENWHELG
jgi:hypothetical protein